MVIGRIEKSAHELKNDLIKEIRKLEERAKSEIRGIRSAYALRIRKIKMIASVDDVRRLTSSVDMQQTKYVELIKRYGADKEQEVRAVE